MDSAVWMDSRTNAIATSATLDRLAAKVGDVCFDWSRGSVTVSFRCSEESTCHSRVPCASGDRILRRSADEVLEPSTIAADEMFGWMRVVRQAMLPASATTTTLLSNGVCKWLQLPAVVGVLQGMHVREGAVPKLDYACLICFSKVECLAYFHWKYFCTTSVWIDIVFHCK